MCSDSFDFLCSLTGAQFFFFLFYWISQRQIHFYWASADANSASCFFEAIKSQRGAGGRHRPSCYLQFQRYKYTHNWRLYHRENYVKKRIIIAVARGTQWKTISLQNKCAIHFVWICCGMIKKMPFRLLSFKWGDMNCRCQTKSVRFPFFPFIHFLRALGNMIFPYNVHCHKTDLNMHVFQFSLSSFFSLPLSLFFLFCPSIICQIFIHQ